MFSSSGWKRGGKDAVLLGPFEKVVSVTGNYWPVFNCSASGERISSACSLRGHIILHTELIPRGKLSSIRKQIRIEETSEYFYGLIPSGSIIIILIKLINLVTLELEKPPRGVQ